MQRASAEKWAYRRHAIVTRMVYFSGFIPVWLPQAAGAYVSAAIAWGPRLGSYGTGGLLLLGATALMVACELRLRHASNGGGPSTEPVPSVVEGLGMTKHDSLAGSEALTALNRSGTTLHLVTLSGAPSARSRSAATL